jgi:hypothetical protein
MIRLNGGKMREKLDRVLSSSSDNNPRQLVSRSKNAKNNRS